MSHFIATLDLLSALKAKCEALEFSPGVKLFDTVRTYHTPDLIRALRELQAQKARVCFLIPSGDDFDNAFAGRDLRSGATREIIMLLTDRSVASATAASTGSASTPGVVKIKDLVIESLLGEQLGFSPRLVRLRPVEGQPVIITIEDQAKQPGRQAWQITWHADAGETSVTPTL
jgi:hypothetical protein